MLTIERKRRKETLKAAIRKRDPQGVANVLILPEISSTSKGDRNKLNAGRYEEETLMDGDVDWSGVLKYLNEACYRASVGDISGCYEAQSSLHSALNHIFGGSNGNWLVLALQTACVNTHRTAVHADAREGREARNDHARLQNAVTLLQESFSKTLNDRTELKSNAPLSEDGSKKAGVLFIVNQLFSMYFRLNTLRLCRNLVLPVERQALHQQGKMGQMVTYCYYVGRLNMFEDQYESAEHNLDFALNHCHKDATANKRKILNYLLPVKLLRGRLPTQKLLQKYSLYEFLPLVEGIRNGDLRSFNDALLKYQDLFIRRGTYLLLEKCKTVCYRNLFKRVFMISERTQVPLPLMLKTFAYLGMPIDLDEIECILANLIFRGFVKGYISHTKRILVLSKRDPFPVSAIIIK